ncbi:trypsin-like peptidase domain-containing protein [Streptomyces sp. NPDC056672]|uniref:S1 family peptidase n=1 Tax=Streptomyces sp. NPDC056672 TaxID=3345906 RepID=UPI0036CE05EF
MKTDRVVEVWAGLGNGEWMCGSGYLVTARLVLTAAHVIVADSDGHRSYHTLATNEVIRLRAEHADTLYAGRVVWRGQGEDLDVALVEITDEDWPKKVMTPVRWGRTTCHTTRVDCAAAGFPQVLRLPDRRRDREHLSGRINPAAGDKAGQYHVQVDNAPSRHMDGESPWAGMSGAALFSDGLLIGVVIIDLDGFDGRRLTAVRMTEVFADTDFFNLIMAHCDTPDRPGPPYLPVLESAELAALFSGRRTLQRPHSPATLLTAQVAAVRWFHGREGKVADLQNWLASDEQPLEARLIVGPGGYGKTRLARELEHRAREGGWVTGMVQAERADKLPADPLERLDSCRLPLLLIVDYAETRPDVVRRLLEAVDPYEGPKVRLLMLARSPGKWWESLWGSTWQLQEAVALDEVDVLGPLPQDGEHRLEAFHEAAADLSVALPKVRGLREVDWAGLTERLPVPDLSRHRYTSIMQIHLAALVALLQQGPTRVSALGEGAMPEDLLITHEMPYWRASAKTHKVELGDDSLANAVTVATLMGAADRNQALAALARVRGLDGQSEGQLMDVDQWLTTLYPASGTGRWGALEPDRLGEHLVATQLRDWPDLLTEPLAAATPAQLHRAFHVLARAGVHHASARTALRLQVVEQLSRTGPTALAVALESEAPEFLIEVLEEGVEGAAASPEMLAELAEAFPAAAPELTILAERVTRLERAVYQRLLTAGVGDYLARLARATRRHAEHLHVLGRANEALAAQSEAVGLFRELTGGAQGRETQP